MLPTKALGQISVFRGISLTDLRRAARNSASLDTASQPSPYRVALAVRFSPPAQVAIVRSSS